MKKKKIIGIDFDDVLMELNANLQLFHNDRYGTNFSKADVTAYELYNLWGCSFDESIERLFEFYESEFHHTTPPVVGSKEKTKKLIEHYSVHIITARPTSMKEKTKHWLSEHFPHLAHSIHFTNGIGGGVKRKKSEVCKELGVDIFIDDALHHMEEVAPYVSEVLLFDAPWNQKKDGELPSNVTRVFSWDDIISRLLHKR